MLLFMFCGPLFQQHKKHIKSVFRDLFLGFFIFSNSLFMVPHIYYEKIGTKVPLYKLLNLSKKIAAAGKTKKSQRWGPGGGVRSSKKSQNNFRLIYVNQPKKYNSLEYFQTVPTYPMFHRLGCRGGSLALSYSNIIRVVFVKTIICKRGFLI